MYADQTVSFRSSSSDFSMISAPVSSNLLTSFTVRETCDEEYPYSPFANSFNFNGSGKLSTTSRGYFDSSIFLISNDEGEAIKEIKDWLNDNGTKYMYSTQDEYGVSATITNDEIYLGCETTDSFQRIKGEMYYVPDNCQYSDYSKSIYKLEYENKEI